MNRCNEPIETISSFLDGELSSTESDRFVEHCSSCQLCRETLESLRALKHAIARLPARGEATAASQAKVDRIARSTRRSVHRPTAVAMIAFVVVCAGYFVRLSNIRAAAATSLVADHYRSIPSSTLPQVVSSDPVTIAKFFDGRMNFEPVVPELHGATLLGARLCTIDESRAELLLYDITGSPVSLFISKKSPRMPSSGCTSREATTLCSGVRGDTVIHAVGTLPRERLETIIAEAISP